MAHKHPRKQISPSRDSAQFPTKSQSSQATDEFASVAPEPGPPAVYLPFSDGRYHVTPNLFSFETDFGNGPTDQQLFQIDAEFARYRQNKQSARAESLDKYVCLDELDAQTARRLHAFIIDTLTRQHPHYFQRRQHKNMQVELHNRLTGETLVFDADFGFLAGESPSPCHPRFVSGIDALAAQVQEDIAVLKTGNDNDRLIALHLCAPNHWAPREKIGQSFISVHHPVVGMDRVNKKSRPLLNALLQRGPFVRFAWGLATDRHLNHHPEPPPATDPARWAGREFAKNEAIYLRVERQTLHGFPAAHIVLFTIRTYIYPVQDVIQNSQNKAQLVSAIESMTPEQLRYKGLYKQRDVILSWIQEH